MSTPMIGLGGTPMLGPTGEPMLCSTTACCDESYTPQDCSWCTAGSAPGAWKITLPLRKFWRTTGASIWELPAGDYICDDYQEVPWNGFLGGESVGQNQCTWFGPDADYDPCWTWPCLPVRPVVIVTKTANLGFTQTWRIRAGWADTNLACQRFLLGLQLYTETHLDPYTIDCRRTLSGFMAGFTGSVGACGSCGAPNNCQDVRDAGNITIVPL